MKHIASDPPAVQGSGGNVEAGVQSRIAELTRLATYLFQVREDERRDLARELHDELGSLLTAAKLDAGFIKSKCAAANPALLDKCARLADMIDKAMALKRRVIDELRPSTLDMLGLSAATRELVENFAAASKITVRGDIDPDIEARDDNALALYRILQEALANVDRHADAREVEIRLSREGRMLHARVVDNGKGFSPVASGRLTPHGLDAIRERARGLGGRVVIESTPGTGTAVDVWMPVQSD